MLDIRNIPEFAFHLNLIENIFEREILKGAFSIDEITYIKFSDPLARKFADELFARVLTYMDFQQKRDEMALTWIEDEDENGNGINGRYECNNCGYEYPDKCKCLSDKAKKALLEAKIKSISLDEAIRLTKERYEGKK